MFQKNPLFLIESKAKLLKRLSRYTPQEVSKIREKMIALGKENGGWYGADEYGKRMIAGQKLRGQKIASKYGRRLSVLRNGDDINGTTAISSDPKINDIITYTRNPFLSKKTQSEYLRSALEDKGENRLPRKVIRKQFLRMNNQKNPNLTAGNILSHEMDEYSLGLDLAKKLNIHTKDVVGAAGLHYVPGSTNLQSVRSSHFPGVLEREAKRNHLINTLYGRDATLPLARDSRQFASNKKKHILNNSLTKEFSKRNNLDPEIRRNFFSNVGEEKLTRREILILKRAERNKLLKNIKKEKEILRNLGFEMDGKSLDDVEKLYNTYSNRTEFSKIVNKEAQRLGIPLFVPNPNPGVKPFIPTPLKGKIPEGSIPNPQYYKIAKQMANTREQLGSYLDNLEKLQKISL